jgi:hypothetical protein
MRISNTSSSALMLACILVGAASLHAQEVKHVPYPDSYRSWQLVKSIVVGPDSTLFGARGGIHHYYANSLAIIGYRTGKFPEGSIIVDEAMWMKDGDGLAKGIWLENGQRFLEVMSKDANYKSTDGWGFERFDADTHNGQLDAESQSHCHACHENAKDRDHVYSSLRP